MIFSWMLFSQYDSDLFGFSCKVVRDNDDEITDDALSFKNRGTRSSYNYKIRQQ